MILAEIETADLERLRAWCIQLVTRDFDMLRKANEKALLAEARADRAEASLLKAQHCLAFLADQTGLVPHPAYYDATLEFARAVTGAPK